MAGPRMGGFFFNFPFAHREMKTSHSCRHRDMKIISDFYFFIFFLAQSIQRESVYMPINSREREKRSSH